MSNLEQIHQCRHYEAYVLRGESLIVHKRNKMEGGKQLVGPVAKDWINAIKTAIDVEEGSNLCKAILLHATNGVRIEEKNI